MFQQKESISTPPTSNYFRIGREKIAFLFFAINARDLLSSSLKILKYANRMKISFP